MLINNKTPFIYLFFAVTLVFMLSEFVYSINHRPFLYFLMSKYFAYSKNTQTSEKFLDIAATKVPYFSESKWKECCSERINFSDAKYSEFNEKYCKYVLGMPIIGSHEDGTHYIAKIYYDLGLLSYTTGRKELFVHFLNKAINLEPYFSFYYVELANYYMLDSDNNKAMLILDKCVNIIQTNAHCKQYYNDNFLQNKTNTVGFLNTEIKSFVK